MTTAKIWALPEELVHVSVEIMQPHGLLGNEGLALWFGNDSCGVTHVTHVVSVEGAGFRSTPLQLRLSLNAMEELTRLGAHLDAYLVGQIHSHPEDMLELSPVDQEFGIRYQDYISLVCPHYAQRPSTSLLDCGVHIFEKGRYRRMTINEVNRRVQIVDSPVQLVRLKVPA